MSQETSQKHKTDTSHPDQGGLKFDGQVTPNLQIIGVEKRNDKTRQQKVRTGNQANENTNLTHN